MLRVTFATRPTDDATLRSFYRLIKPGGPGWKRVIDLAREQGDAIDVTDSGGSSPLGILCLAIGGLAVYSTLFATGYTDST